MEKIQLYVFSALVSVADVGVWTIEEVKLNMLVHGDKGSTAHTVCGCHA